jgi:Collagen triple helix repeat (20 copies)
VTDHQGERGRTGPAGETGAAGTAGRVGETGLTGLTGDTGETGVSGDTGARGEAGAAGRQGEAGVSGRQGEAGTAGLPGTPGTEGLRGAAGRPGRSLTRAQALALFAFIVAAAAVLGVRSETNAHNISVNQRRIADNQRTACAQTADLARELNALADALVRAETRRGSPDPRLAADLAAVKTQVIGC